MSTVAAANAAGTPNFTAAEIGHLRSWGRANRLDVTIEAVASDLAGAVACVGQGFGMVSWTIHRTQGHLWLSLVGDWMGRSRPGWTLTVSSVEEATARIAGMLATGWR